MLAMVKAGALWGVIGIVAGLITYRVASKRGALEVPGGARWPRLALGLGLAFVTVPAFVMMGVVTGMRDRAVQLVDEQVAESEAAELVGEVLLAPMAAAEDTDDVGAVVRWARVRAARFAPDKLARYQALFAAGQDTRAIGRTFVKRELTPEVKKTFDGVRTPLMLVALLPPFGVLFAAFFLRRRGRARETVQPTG